MTVARASATFGRTILRRTAAQTRAQTWRQLGRRGYASAEHAKKSSDLPWMIGSVVATVPAAVWLIGQAPKKSEHHGHGSSHGKEEESTEEQPEEQQEEEKPSEDESSDDAKTEKTDDSEDESKEEKEDSKDESESKDDKKEESKEEDKDDSKGESGDSNVDEHGLGKGPGEGQKAGERKPTEKKGEKDAASDYSGAKNPYLDDDEKSKKGEGLKETAKIHGTVDSRRPARGDGKSNEE